MYITYLTNPCIKWVIKLVNNNYTNLYLITIFITKY